MKKKAASAIVSRASKALSGKKGVKKAVAKKGAFATRSAAAKKATTKTPAVLRGISTVVINLEKRPDRWAKVQKSVARQAPWLPMARLNAVDGRAYPPPKSEVTAKWSTARLAQLFHWYKAVTIPMSPGERGCCASHVAAWRKAAKMSKPLIVLEDDAVALGSFAGTIEQAVREAPKDTGMIFLSSKDRGWPKPFGEVLMKPHYVWTTVGYIVYPQTAKQLLKMLPMDMPVDNFLAWHIKEGTIKAYSVRPAAVRQAQTWNVGSDVPHSDDVAHR